MMLTMLIDLDHLFSTPVFDANRCSIGFHPLHQWFMLPVYVLLLFAKKTRLIAIGLCIHMFLDFTDCVAMQNSHLADSRQVHCRALLGQVQAIGKNLSICDSG